MKHVLLLCSALSLICSSSSAQVWQSLNDGLKYIPVAMTEVEKTIAVAYKVGETDGSVQFGISIWNGQVWAHLPTIKCDSAARINALKWYKKELYIGGQFNQFNSIKNARSLVKFSNRQYVNVENINTSTARSFDNILDLNIYNDLLVVAGQFTSTKAINSANLGFFNGDKWVESGIKEMGAINGGVLTTLGSGNHFYIGGVFTKVGTERTKYLAHFEKGELIPFTYNYARPYHMVEYNKGIVMAGTINANETPMYFFSMGGDTVKKMMTGLDQVNYISDMVAAGDVIYACGLFKFSVDQKVYTIIKYEDGKWSPLAVGQLPGARKLLYHNDLLFTSGEFKEYRNITLNGIAVLPTQINKSIISGTVYHDKDINCEFNGRDEKLNDNIIRIEPGGRLIRPNANGLYKIYVEKGEYTVSVIPKQFWKAPSCASLTQKVIVDAGDVSMDIDFPLVQESNIKDMSVKLVSSSGSVANRNNVQQYYIGYENKGSTELVEGIVSLVFDSKLNDFKSEPVPLKIEGDTAYWNINDLSPGEGGQIKCKFRVKSGSEELIHLTANVIQNEVEQNDDNNTSTITQRILTEDHEVYKFVNPETNWSDTAIIDLETESITYQISFANYTNDTVRTVYVIDTVDLNETIWEIEDVSWSHPYIENTVEGPKYEDYSIITYEFRDINLPPNPTQNGEIVNDEGHIAFVTTLTGNMQIGKKFFNRAYVKFDYTLDTVTNEVMAVVEEESSIFEVPSNQPLTIFPNPANDIITVEIPEHNVYAPFSITAITGNEMIHGELTTDNKIAVSSLIPGVYFIKVETESGLYTAKMIKN
jgi:hypothetical protein